MGIEPDDKDWTWVLTRPCPDCGFDPVGLDRDDLPKEIRGFRDRWLAVLDAPDVARRTRDDRWSPLEYACHVRDVCTVFDGRLAQILDGDDPIFPNWDQDRTARDEHYDRQVPAEVASGLATAATALADRFEGVSGSGWDRAGTRSNGSRFTVATLGTYLLHDPVHHLWDLTTL